MWFIEWDASESFAREACGEAEGGCELHGLGGADAFDFRKFSYARAGELAEAAKATTANVAAMVEDRSFMSCVFLSWSPRFVRRRTPALMRGQVRAHLPRC